MIVDKLEGGKLDCIQWFTALPTLVCFRVVVVVEAAASSTDVAVGESSFDVIRDFCKKQGAH